MAASLNGTTSPLAVFRFDASARAGAGHAVRCLALADALAASGWRCALASAAAASAVVPALGRCAHQRLELDCAADAEAGTLAGRWPGGCDLLVVDHYGRGAAFEGACRPWARRVMVIDDLADRAHDCDVLLDQTPGRRAEDYGALVPGGCRLVLGPRHALLRPQFAAARGAALSRRRAGGPVRRILVSIGATDPDNVTATVLEGLARAGVAAEVEVVMGAGAPHLAAVRARAGDLSGTLPVTVTVGAGNMAALMADADIAVGAAGTASWERCCLGLPAVVLVVAENQRAGAKALAGAGAARILDAPAGITATHVAAAVEGLCRSADERRRMGLAAADLCDGRGVARVVVDHLPAERGRDGMPVTLRLARRGDAAIMLEWQSDERTRRYARGPRAPTPAEHEQWLGRYMGKTDGILTIILHDGEASGVLRLDRTAEGAGFEVSILVAPEKYGRGIGKAVLALARKLLPGDDLFAEILPANAASHALFRSAGFRPVREGLYVSTPPDIAEAPHAG